MLACLNGHLESVQVLLDAAYSAVDCNHCDKSGNSVLLYAVESGRVDIVEAVVRHPVHGQLLDPAELRRAKETADMIPSGSHIARVLATVLALRNGMSTTLCSNHSLNGVSDEEDIEDLSD